MPFDHKEFALVERALADWAILAGSLVGATLLLGLFTALIMQSLCDLGYRRQSLCLAARGWLRYRALRIDDRFQPASRQTLDLLMPRRLSVFSLGPSEIAGYISTTLRTVVDSFIGEDGPEPQDLRDSSLPYRIGPLERWSAVLAAIATFPYEMLPDRDPALSHRLIKTVLLGRSGPGRFNADMDDFERQRHEASWDRDYQELLSRLDQGVDDLHSRLIGEWNRRQYILALFSGTFVVALPMGLSIISDFRISTIIGGAIIVVPVVLVSIPIRMLIERLVRGSVR